MEVWKDIKGFEGLYQISNKGRFKSLARPCKGYGYKFAVDRIRKPTVLLNGYLEAQLHKDGKTTVKMLHRLVAEAFIPNPDNLPQVNHKDEDIQNNCVENLEWCTAKYNANYGNRQKKCRESSKKYYKPVNQYDLDGNFIKKWECIADASKALGIIDSQISRVCKHTNITAGGYKWEYVNDL